MKNPSPDLAMGITSFADGMIEYPTGQISLVGVSGPAADWKGRDGMLPHEDSQTYIVRDRPEFARLDQAALLHLFCHHFHGAHREDCKA